MDVVALSTAILKVVWFCVGLGKLPEKKNVRTSGLSAYAGKHKIHCTCNRCFLQFPQQAERRP